MSSSLTKHEQAAKIRIAVTLLEHAMGLLTAITREAPSLDLGPTIAGINRQILSMQGKLIGQEQKL